LLLIVALSILYYYLLKKSYKESFESGGGGGGSTGPREGNVPKKIWTYWNDENMPPSVDLCIKSWRKINPDYEIIIMTKKNYREYVSIPDSIANHPNMNDSHARFADLLRIYVIAEHGGIWADASIIMNQAINEWMYATTTSAEFYGFHTFYKYERPHYIIENWFFAAPPNSSFVKKWRDEFIRLAEYPTVADYIHHLDGLGVDFKDWTGDPHYLTMHAAVVKIQQIDKHLMDRIFLIKSEDGPFRYLFKNNWDAYKSLTYACKYPEFRKPFMKITHYERPTFEKHLNDDFSNEKCMWY
jgi:hypothetical protein